MIQNQFLNKLLTSKDPSLLFDNNIDKDFFSDYLKEYEFISEHLKEYGNIPDIYTFLQRFPDFDVIEVFESNDFLVNKLYEDRNSRRLVKTFNQVRDLVNTGDTEKALQVFIDSQKDMLQAQKLTSVDIIHDVSRFDAFIDRCSNFSKYYIKTGFPELDEITGGWDRQEELATIVARSNQGKTWILLKCACAALEQGLTVGIYSGEMSDRKVGYRIDTLLSHISNSSLVKGNIEVRNEYKQYLTELPTKYTGTIKVLTPNSIGGPAGVNSLRAFIEKDKLDILFVDQHSLLEDDRHAKNPVEKASNISRDLKNLQVMKQIPIISVSQQNRSSTENGVGLEHVAASDRIAQDSTIVLFFEQKDGVMTLHLVKSRDSINMKDLKYSIDLNIGKFTYIPEGNDNDEKLDEILASYGDVGEEIF